MIRIIFHLPTRNIKINEMFNQLIRLFILFFLFIACHCNSISTLLIISNSYEKQKLTWQNTL